MVKISIKIGGSCIGRFSRVISGTTCAEVRLLQNNEHPYAWQDIEFCIKNNIYCIVNIDSYITGGHWRPTNSQLRNFVIETKTRLREFGATKLNCRFTYDNESNEYLQDFNDYMNGVRVVHDALNKEFDLGAGNFTTQAKDWYESLAKLNYQKYYEYFDFHMQDGLNSEYDIDKYIEWIYGLSIKYNIEKLAVTEGNNFYNVSTPEGHNLLKAQITYAEVIGCSDFCFVYANWQHNSEEDDDNMAYCWNGIPLASAKDNWNDMLNFINSKKSIEDDDMKLDKLYKKGSKGIGVKFIQKVVNKYMGSNLIIDGIWGDLTEAGVREFQEAKGLQIDGKVGIETFPAMIEEYPNIWNQIQYAWAIGVR